MAVSMRTVAAQGTVARTARPAVVCRAADNKAIAAVAIAAAAIISAPAQAGVVLEQPTLKKVFQSDDTPVERKERPFRNPLAASTPAPATSDAAPAAPKPKVAEEPLGDGGLDPRVVALPASVAAIAGLALAASKIDGGFNEWINESGALVRNSGAYAGFEEDIKGDNYFPAPGSRKVKAGTTKIGTKKGRK